MGVTVDCIGQLLALPRHGEIDVLPDTVQLVAHALLGVHGGWHDLLCGQLLLVQQLEGTRIGIVTLLVAAEAGHIQSDVDVGGVAGQRRIQLIITDLLFLTISRLVSLHCALVADNLLLHAAPAVLVPVSRLILG